MEKREVFAIILKSMISIFLIALVVFIYLRFDITTDAFKTTGYAVAGKGNEIISHVKSNIPLKIGIPEENTTKNINITINASSS